MLSHHYQILRRKKEVIKMSRCLLLLSSVILLLTYHLGYTEAHASDQQSIIIEVEGDPTEHQAYLDKYHPLIDVVAVYDQLFNGLALQAPRERLTEISSLEFIKATHSVQTYEANIVPPKQDRKSTRLNSSHVAISYAAFCL